VEGLLKKTEIAVECSVLDIGFSFDVRRSMFDVQCSTFIFQMIRSGRQSLAKSVNYEMKDA